MSSALDLSEALASGDRRALAKAITLVESSREDDRKSARELFSRLGPVPKRTFRVGVTGVPGAGKSTLIEALGMHAIGTGRRVAVLAVDPSSRKSGGSVLADKTRMTRLSADAAAFVRPSPTLGVLGGTAARTHELVAVCEAAGYDLIFVETVGVGQSEERVASMVDCVLVLLLAGAGDDISSMKRGLLEAADVLAFNKADGDRASQVEHEAAALRATLSISRGENPPPVLVVSALEGSGIAALWAALAAWQTETEQTGRLAARRREQRKAWFDAAIEDAWRSAFVNRPDLLTVRDAAERSVENGAATPLEAAERLVSELLPPHGR